VRRGFSSGGGAIRKTSKRERKRFQQPQKSLQRYDLAMAAIAMMEGRPVDPDTAQVLKDIALAQQLYNAGKWDDAEPIIRKFLHRPGFVQPMTYDALGSIAQYQGRYDVAIECFRKALALDPDYVEARNRIIMILDVQPDTSIRKAQRERDRWWVRHGADLYAKRRPHLNNRDPERPIRVGYVSGDFQYHSAATVFHRIALNHSDGFVPYFYSSTPSEQWDSITNSYMAMPGWRNLVDRSGGGDIAWPDSLVYDKIRDDQIDILVDLSGYTAWNRLQVFCAKPAPIQVTGWGYATGVGWPAMDYLISDRVVIPEDRQREHVEKILYLPSVIDYEPTLGLPEANPLPCLTERPTFGVFQRSLKINAEDVEVWRQVLERLPESRLIMKGLYCPSLTAWIKEHFGAQVSQVEFQGVTSSFDHKCAYAQVDLNLDPFPQTGGVSACDALWQGVPAVTLLGPRVIQRTTASLLTILGLTDFIAQTPEEYVTLAVDWVTTRKHELADIRQGLRAKCDASPIRHGYREATEAGFRHIWREWCAKPLSIADAQYRLEQAS
jgi:protein O-GlcNAc transferase